MSRADQSGIGRRRFLGILGVGAAGVAVGVGGAAAVHQARPDEASEASSQAVGSLRYPFYGDHQAGLATPPQAQARLLGFTLPADATVGSVRTLMQEWTIAAAALTQGRQAGADPLEVLVAEPAGLTVTFGFGPGFFDTLGFREQRPPGVAAMPPFAGDELQPRWTGGDLLVQICAWDAVVISHAASVLTTLAADRALPHWVQTGFRRDNGVAAGQTVRNLMGNKDGTGNDSPDNPRFDQTVWAAAEQGLPGWYTGGTTLVLRRISMDLAAWSASELRVKERTIGRHLDSGAPLGETDEFAPVPLNAQEPDGSLTIPSSAHVRLTHPDSNSGARMVRRGYNYDDGSDAGLLFIALQADATRGFIPVQSRMAAGDDLNRFITPIGTSVFAMPPGCAEGGYIGQTLLG